MKKNVREKYAPQYYPYVLDFKPGFFLGRLLYSLFKRVRYRPEVKERLRKAGREGTVVYIIKHRGELDFLLYHFRFRQDRIPFPRVSLGVNMILWWPLKTLWGFLRHAVSDFFKRGKKDEWEAAKFFREEVTKGTTALLFLVDEKAFYERYLRFADPPLLMLLEVQKEMDRPVFLVPLTFVYELQPEKQEPSLSDLFFGSKDNPGLIRKIILFLRYYRRAFIDVGPFINLKDRLPEDADHETMRGLSRQLSDELLNHIDRQRRVVLGPLVKTRQQIRELVLDNPEMKGEIEEFALQQDRSVKSVRKKAKAYFDEIAANYNATYIHIWVYVLTFIFKKIFDDVEVDAEGMVRIREAARNGTLVYVPCHRSHVDYLVLNYVLFKHSLHTPRVAAGKNLSFWPIGHVFRNSGAFFLRRTFKGIPLYAKVFNHYVQTLLGQGYPIEFFIEGGRSRSGKMILPKLGFLSITLNTYLAGKCDELVFVPVHIGYDHIMEEQYYLKELGGKEKKKEGLWQMLRARKFLRRRYGRVYIRFAQPMSVGEYFASREPESLEGEERKREAFKDFSLKVMHAINEVTLVTPVSLAASVLLTMPGKGFSKDDVMATARILLDFLTEFQAPVLETLDDLDGSLEAALEILRERGVLEQLEDDDFDDPPFYNIEDDRRLGIEYYKNNIVHHFVPAAFAAFSLLSAPNLSRSSDELRDDVEFLASVMEQEFIISPERFSQEELDRISKYFISKGFVRESEEGERGELQVTSSGVGVLQSWTELVAGFVESYWIVFLVLGGLDDKPHSERELLRKIKSKGTRWLKRAQVEHASALSMVCFKNALKQLQAWNLITVDQSSGEERLIIQGEHEFLKEAGKRLREFSRKSGRSTGVWGNPQEERST